MKLSSKNIFLLLTIALACLYVWPDLNWQDLLSQGDHGRDLYAFGAVTRGDLPYKDFWWVYGPIMPYYYGLFYKIFGFHITSILLGKAVLVVLCSVFFYLAAATIMAPGLAFLAGAWFTQSRQEFFFTYNHIGGILAELIIAYCLFSYVRRGQMRYLWISLIADFALMLVKVNFGLAGLVGILVTVFGIDHIKRHAWTLEKKKFYLVGGLLLPAITAVIYWALLKDLPLYAIRQCMPYLPSDHPYHVSPLIVIPYYLKQQWLSFVHGPIGPVIGLVLHGCTIIAAYVLLARKIAADRRQNILLAIGITWLFFILYFHEFIVSGVWYRTYWSLPFLMMFHFIMIATAFTIFPKALRIVILVFLWGLVSVGIVAHIGSIQSQKVPPRYLSMDRGQIYVGNEPQWTNTVNTVTHYLDTHLQKNELFFALPYDCLYYYLTGKPSPTRQLIFFDHIHIPVAQEVSIIRELESKKVNYVLMSNRIISPETGLGIFGQTYCPLLAAYIHDNFTPVFHQGGDPHQPPGWANNHGVIILKRK